jgi:hypothetical protein
MASLQETGKFWILLLKVCHSSEVDTFHNRAVDKNYTQFKNVVHNSGSDTSCPTMNTCGHVFGYVKGTRLPFIAINGPTNLMTEVSQSCFLSCDGHYFERNKSLCCLLHLQLPSNACTENPQLKRCHKKNSTHFLNFCLWVSHTSLVIHFIETSIFAKNNVLDTCELVIKFMHSVDNTHKSMLQLLNISPTLDIQNRFQTMYLTEEKMK